MKRTESADLSNQGVSGEKHFVRRLLDQLNVKRHLTAMQLDRSWKVLESMEVISISRDIGIARTDVVLIAHNQTQRSLVLIHYR